MRDNLLPLLTQDPVTSEPLIVTRLESPGTGMVIEGGFSLSWMGRLTPEQLDFVGLLVQNRGNVQRLGADLGVAYNTARARLDEIVAALGVPPEPEAPRADRADILRRLSEREITYEEAMNLLRR